MQPKITAIIGHMSRSHLNMARILEADRHMAEHTAALLRAIPDNETTFSGAPVITEHAMAVTKSVATYLNSLAELEDAMADTLTAVMKELSEASEE